jgi:hypothetical protein
MDDMSEPTMTAKTQERLGVGESDASREATLRAQRAEAELAQIKDEQTAPRQEAESGNVNLSGEAENELRKDSMMAHLLDSLRDGLNIGHYGRLVFAMVARHFMPQEEVVQWLMRDPDFDEAAAVAMLRQVEGRDYNPPKRERILEWQAQQEFPILPNPEDPDCGNLYRNLKFPEEIYEHIQEYQEKKAAAES